MRRIVAAFGLDVETVPLSIAVCGRKRAPFRHGTTNMSARGTRPDSVKVLDPPRPQRQRLELHRPSWRFALPVRRRPRSQGDVPLARSIPAPRPSGGGSAQDRDR